MRHRTKGSFDFRWSRAALAAVLVVLLSPSAAPAARENIRFTRYNLEEGLSQSAVRAIVQDAEGFLWFGTEDGLNRYDGFNFKIYRNDPDKPDSLSQGNIYALAVDRKGRLWIGTVGGGLNMYDPGTDRFTRYRFNPDDPASLSDDSVAAVLEDRAGKIWIGTNRGGLNSLDPETGTCVRYRANPDIPGSLPDDAITALAEDGNGRLWVGTRNSGLCAFDSQKGNFWRASVESRDEAYQSIVTLCRGRNGDLWAGTAGGVLRLDAKSGQARPLVIGSEPMSPAARGTAGWRVTEDSRGILWIGTLGDGLYRYDPERGSLQRFRNDPLSPTSLGNNFVYRVFEDSGGVLWIATENGLNKTDLNAKKFLHYASVASDPSSLGNNYVKAFTEDPRGIIWVGALQGGVSAFDPGTEAFIRYRHDPGNPGSLSGDRITALHTGPTGTVWIGIYGRGVDRYDPASRTFRRVPIDSLPSSGINDPRVMSVLEDRTGRLWVGTQTGLHRFDPRTGQSTMYRGDPRKPGWLSHDYVYALLEDRKGRVWAGTFGGGLCVFDADTGTFRRYQSRPENPSSLSGDFISFLSEDAAGILWVGTAGNGFNRLDPESGAVRRYTDQDGLPNNSIYGICPDDKGKLWLSTNMGLSRFDPKTGTFRNFDVSDGLQSNEFNGAAAFRSRSGEMYFGGINGFNRFRPGDIVDNAFAPPVVLTDFRILGRSLFAGDAAGRNAALRKNLAESRRIDLSFRDRVIDIEFAAMHFAAPQKNRYAYKMEGFDPDWSPLGIRRLATYTNLPGGRYVFRARVTNNDGAWSDRELALPIRIAPPFWQTLWFRGLAVLAGLLAILSYVRVHTNRIRARNIVLERRVEERTEKLKSANRELEREIGERTKAQSALQASLKEKEILLREIHHRVKNNMQVVSSFLSIQARAVNDDRVQDIFLKTQDRIRMMALIHENLYKSKDLAGIDAQGFLRETVYHLASYILHPEKVILRAEISNVTLDIDTAIPCGLIVNELVTNAVKYAFPPEIFRTRSEGFKGEIVVSFLPAEDGGYVLSVRDNGTGLPEGLDAGKAGSLGLQLVKGLVGQIQGTLEIGRTGGTAFTILFGRKSAP